MILKLALKHVFRSYVVTLRCNTSEDWYTYTLHVIERWWSLRKYNSMKLEAVVSARQTLKIKNTEVENIRRGV